MKFGIFLILLSCCFYLATARPNDSDTESEVNSENVAAEKSDSEESDDGASQSGSDSGSDEDKDWDDISDSEEDPEDKDLDENDKNLMDRIRRKLMNDYSQGKVYGSEQATKRLTKEYRDFLRSKSVKSGIFEVELIDESLYDWKVSVKGFDPDFFDLNSPLIKDLEELNKTVGIDRIVLHFKFDEKYPFDAPFVRIVSPVLTGKHVLTGGGICMELLVPVGWVPTYNIETITTEIMYFMIVGNGRIPKQDKNYARVHYSYEAAKLGFRFIPGWFANLLKGQKRA